MAGMKIRGVTIEFDGDTSKLQQSLQSVNKDLRKTDSALKDVNKLLKLDPNNVTLLKQKQELLKKAIKETNERLDLEKQALAELAKADQTPEVTAQMQALERQIADDEMKLKSLQGELDAFENAGVKATKSVSEKFKDFGSKLNEIGDKIGDVGQKLMPVSAAAAAVGGALLKMGYDTVQSADELATLSKQTGISVEELQKMKYASELVDVSVEDITGALRKMKPKMTENNKVFQELGVSVTNADGSLRDATDVFYDSIAALSKISNETERDQMAMQLFGKSADELAGIIDDGGAALKQYGQEAADAGLILSTETVGALADTSDEIEKVKADMTGTMAEVGADLAKTLAPALKKVSQYIKDVTAKIRKLTPEQQKTILKIVGIVAAIAPALAAISKVTKGISSVISIIGTVVGVLGGPLTIAIAAAIAIGVLLYKNWDTIKKYAQDLYKAISDKFKAIKDAVTKYFTDTKNIVSQTWESIKKSITDVVNNVKSAVSNAFNSIKSGIENVMGGISSGLSTAWDGIKSSVSTAVDNVKSSVSSGWENMKSAVSNATDSIKKTASDAWDSVKSTAASKFDEIKTNASTKWAEIKTSITNPIETAKNNLATYVSNIASSLGFSDVSSQAVKSVFASVQSAITDPIGTAKSTISNLITGIKGLVDFSGLSSGVQTAFNAVQSAITSPFDTAKSLVSSAVSTIKGLFPIKLGNIFSSVKLPHFNISGGKAPWGIGGQGVKPSISISWYKKAYDQPYLFTTPTIVNGRGFGDGGGSGEIVYGRDNLLRDIAAATQGNITVNVYGTDGMSVNQLADAVQYRLVQLQRQRERAFA